MLDKKADFVKWPTMNVIPFREGQDLPMNIQTYDIFRRLESGELVWMYSTHGLDEVKARLIEFKFPASVPARPAGPIFREVLMCVALIFERIRLHCIRATQLRYLEPFPQANAGGVRRASALGA